MAKIPGQAGLWCSRKPLVEQLIFESFKRCFTAFEWSWRRYSHVEPSLCSELGRHSIISSIHVYLSVFRRHPGGMNYFNKKPAIDWQSRVFWRICLVWLRVPSRDGGAMPHGRQSNDSLVA